jgi:2-polyprenyl-6-hydroxyphenyl methylase/3-demethylubiquinone-9 3-methyltransferase
MNYDESEINKFAGLANDWWNPQGKLKTLHEINPLRLNYINQSVSLQGKKVLDIGCGGGILAESMAKLGASVTGIDLCEPALAAARGHLPSDLSIDYLCTSAEDFAKNPINISEQFDIVTCLELLEHVPDPASVIKAAADLVKPTGHIFFSTINRNIKSYLFAIIGAEYLLKMLPKNTHDFAKFIRPSELAAWSREAGLTTLHFKGITYSPFTKQYTLDDDISVNYLALVYKDAADSSKV